MWKIPLLVFYISSIASGTYIRKREVSDYDMQVALGYQCETNADCVTDEAICKNEICVCKDGYEERERDRECIEKPQVGSECSTDTDDCKSLVNSSCVDSKCGCITGYVPATDNKSCLKSAEAAGDECQIEQQCSSVPEAVCKDSKCTVPKVVSGLKGKCKASEDCNSTLNLVCEDDTCRCSDIHVQSDDGLTCLPVAKNIGDACVADSQCEDILATCSDNKCIAEKASEEVENCTDGQVASPDSNRCLESAKSIGDACEINEQCSHLSNSTCKNGTCASVLSRLQSPPTIVASSLPIGGYCKTNEDCKVDNTICKEDICECDENYVLSPDSKSCLGLANKEGDACEVDQQCERLSGTKCSEGNCVKPSEAEQGKVLAKDDDGNSATSFRGASLTAIAMLLSALIRLV